MASKDLVTHPFCPIFNRDSQILILGSLPSVQSRNQNFYYGHPRNRFWKVLAAIYGEPVPQTIEEKTAFLLKHHLALWDVIASCTIEGSSDASISQVVPNCLESIFRTASIRKIICNGQTAGRLYHRFQEKQTGMNAVILPSTSPANATWSFERLLEVWKPALQDGQEAAA